MKRELRALSQRGNYFVSAHLTMVARGISVALTIQPPTGRRPAMPLSSKDMMAQFGRKFGNLASAATKSGAALD